MPVAPTFPGVYIEEIPSGVRPITGVATSITAFLGRARRGPTDQAVTINGFADFERVFGGLWTESTLGFAVRDFFLNGGGQAIVVRLFKSFYAPDELEAATAAATRVANKAKAETTVDKARTAARKEADTLAADAAQSQAAKRAAKATADAFGTLKDLPEGAQAADIKTAIEAAAGRAVGKAVPLDTARIVAGDFSFEAVTRGSWGGNLRVRIDLDNIPSDQPRRINLTAADSRPGGASERFLNLSLDPGDPRRADKVLEAESRLIRWSGPFSGEADIGSIRDAISAVKAAREALRTAVAADRDEKEKRLTEALTAFWGKTLDPISSADLVLGRAKELLQKAKNTGTDTVNASREVAAAQASLNDRKATAIEALSDGVALSVESFLPTDARSSKKGLYALEQADLFNLLCIPPYREDPGEANDLNVIEEAVAYCEQRRAMLLVDPLPSWTTQTKAREDFLATDERVGPRRSNAALFFPRLKQPNPLRENRIEDFAPCGAVAGVFARTDTQRGVWKAPAGLDATLLGVPQLTAQLTDQENGELNPLGINCLRAFPGSGRVVWGARTLRGADHFADEYKYIPVRRTALFIEESLFRGLKWVVFEPNDEPLWAQIRLNVGAFMNNLFRQGAFQGLTPREAYFVKCDRETTTQNDINLGVVNVVVGFAPLKPAEFVIIRLQQMAGQIAT